MNRKTILTEIPCKNELQKLCQSISVIDAILSQDWEYRYYSYNKNWDINEEFFEMRNGHGDQMQILFLKNSSIINVFSQEKGTQNKDNLAKDLPSQYKDFMFGEPINSIGTSYCFWSDEDGNWQTNQDEDLDDYSLEMLQVFDAKPTTYLDWATDYYDGNFVETGIPLNSVEKIYKHETLTKDLVLSIVEELEDWEQLHDDLDEIGYPYNFS